MSPSPQLETARRRMLDVDLAGRGINSPRVLRAIAKVPRERFLPELLAERAYDDCALPLDCEQTISQPYIVALMTETLALTGHEHVLEVGTGSGYQTAMLAELAGDVVTIERHEPLSRAAARLLMQLGYSNVTYVIGDGTSGWAAAAPYDRIIVTAAAEECPPRLWQQLREGGVLVGPFGAEHEQELFAVHKIGGQARRVSLTSCRFVPLVSDSPSGA